MQGADLEIVSLATAKAIILPASESDDPDASVIKTMLAIRKDRAESGNPCHIVAEIHHRRNMEVARIVGRDDAELLFTSGLIARIMAQTCRQSGLPAIYTELLNFAGDEIYFVHHKNLFTIGGAWYYDGTEVTFDIMYVPEPSTLLLVGLGMAGLMRRRRGAPS